MAGARHTGFLTTPGAAAAGLILGGPAVMLNQQLLADALYWDCRLGGPVMGLGLSLLTALAALAGGWISWRARSAARGAEGAEPRRFLAEVSAGSAALFLLAIAAMALASVLVPSCHR